MTCFMPLHFIVVCISSHNEVRQEFSSCFFLIFFYCCWWQSSCDHNCPLFCFLLVKRPSLMCCLIHHMSRWGLLKQIKNRWSSRKWRYVWVPRPICWAPCPRDRPQKAIDIYWWHLHAWIHLGASHCMNNAPRVLVCECMHVRVHKSVHLFV